MGYYRQKWVDQWTKSFEKAIDGFRNGDVKFEYGSKPKKHWTEFLYHRESAIARRMLGKIRRNKK